MGPRNVPPISTFLIVALLVVGFSVPTAAAAGPDPVKQVSDAISRATTLAQARQAVTQAKLSPADMQRLTALLKQPPLATKLSELRTLALTQAKTAAANEAHSRATTLNAQASQLVASKNQSLAARLQAMRNGSSSSATSLKKVSLTTQMTTKMQAAGLQVRGSITSCSPNPATVGGTITINGREFGSAQGLVDIVLPSSRLAIECPITSWSATRVVARLPQGLDVLISSAGENARIWLRTNGQELGPAADLRVIPANVPEIRSVSSETIEPAQILLVEGSGFGATAGRITFHFPSVSQVHQGIIDLWSDGGLAVHMDVRVDRLPREVPCEIEVATASGRSVRRNLTFHATLVNEVLFEVEILTSSSGSAFDDGTHTINPSVFIQDLRNGYLVAGSSTRLEHGDYNSRCSYSSAPAVGTSSPHGVLSITGVGDTVCYAFVDIQGPKGLVW